MKVTFEELFSTMREKLIKHGCPEDIAERSARNLASSTRDGVKSHGVYRFTRLVSMIDRGIVKADMTPECVKSLGALEVWDGKYGVGNTNAEDAMNRAMELADKYGIGCVAMKNTNHWMRGGAFGIQAAEKGFASICWTNTIPNLVPWGAMSKEVGNNPLVMGVPYGDRFVIFDGAMSQFSYGALDNAIMAGKKLPVPGGYDKDGNITDDPKEISESGRMFPTGYWKGSSISILMDMMLACLAEGDTVKDIGDRGRSPMDECGLSQIFIALKVSDRSYADSAIARICDSVKNAVPAENVKEVYYPSERLFATRERSMKEGMEIQDKVWEEIKAL
ncbi:MAG: 3-dehydro-L-gulonate 2-dehydrogenase [Treponema sp.]|nr:3-dehydro-L-gulonate 2-dehydrogenase [Treponema sp.]